jgi:pseudaminic acid biosynthesis-associated methylase
MAVFMSDNHSTEQEAFWAGEFGDAYAQRNHGPKLLASNLAFFNRALRSALPPRTCVEFGANIGMNLRALQLLYPGLEQDAVEINSSAATQLRNTIPSERVFEMSILDFTPPRSYDLALIKGVLIHMNPDHLPQIYDKLHAAAGRYLLVCEYYNPAPVEVSYRGHAKRLFKRDFCGEILDRHQDLRLVDYGFAYHRDPSFPQDDITWFLIEKHR